MRTRLNAFSPSCRKKLLILIKQNEPKKATGAQRNPKEPKGTQRNPKEPKGTQLTQRYPKKPKGNPNNHDQFEMTSSPIPPVKKANYRPAPGYAGR